MTSLPPQGIWWETNVLTFFATRYQVNKCSRKYKLATLTCLMTSSACCRVFVSSSQDAIQALVVASTESSHPIWTPMYFPLLSCKLQLIPRHIPSKRLAENRPNCICMPVALIGLFRMMVQSESYCSPKCFLERSRDRNRRIPGIKILSFSHTSPDKSERFSNKATREGDKFPWSGPRSYVTLPACGVRKTMRSFILFVVRDLQCVALLTMVSHLRPAWQG